MGDLLELIVENANRSGKAFRRLTFARAAAQGKPFIAVIATEESGHFHSIVVERIFMDGGEKVAKIIDSEHHLKYLMHYHDLEAAAETYEAILGGSKGSSILVR